MEKLSDIQIINKLHDIFDDNDWELDTFNNRSMYNRFVSILKALNREQQEVFLDLTANFIFYSLQEYETLLMKAILEYIDSEKDFFSKPNKKSVYVVPIVNEDEYTVKSSYLTAYLIKSNTLQYDDRLSNIDWVVLDSMYAEQVRSINKSSKKRVLLIDDFVGSGDTAISFFNACIDKSVDKEKISLLTLVCSSEAIEIFLDNKIPCYFGQKAKSLKDTCSSEEDKIRKISIINEISEVLDIKEKSTLGYGNIMTLTSMVRTPNNTLPIFWKNSKRFQAPFPRL